MSTETVSNNPLVLPAGVRLVSHAVGCAAIYLASHRVLARLRALRRLQLPLDTSDELDRGLESSSDHESSEKADLKAVKEEAEIESLIGSPTTRDSHGGGSLINARVKERRSSERLENGSVDEDGAVIPANSSNDQNSIAGKDGEGKEKKEKKPVTKAEKIRQAIGITAIVIMFAVLIFGLISLTGYLGGFPEKMKEYVTWVYALPMVYLIASWFAEASYAFSPVRASARYVHRKPINKKDPFAIKWELYGPDGEPVYVPGAVERGHAQVKEPQATFWYRADIRRIFGAIGAMACIASAYNERKEYIPFLVLTVVLAMTDSSSSFAKKWKMKWCLLVVGSLVALTITALGVCFLVEAYKKPSPPSEPKKESGTFPLEDWLLPINSAGSLAMPYILPAHLIMIYHRYEDSILYPLTRSLAPGAPTKVTRFETSRHPRTTFSVITLFVFMRTVAWLEVNYPWQHPKSRESNYFMVEFLGGSVLIFLLQVLISIKRGELKAWWRYTEIWCPSAKDQIDGVDGFTTTTDADEKFPLIDTIEDMSSTEKQRFSL